MKALAPKYTPARDWPSLQGKRKYNLILAGKIDRHFSRQFTDRNLRESRNKHQSFSGETEIQFNLGGRNNVFSRQITARINVNQM